jgi:hypothetical protein
LLEYSVYPFCHGFCVRIVGFHTFGLLL